MNEVKDAVRNLVEALKTERDDLRVQINLASADIKDRAEIELSKLETRWLELKSTAKRLNREVEAVSTAVEDDLEDITDNVAESSKAIVDEIREGYKRIRQSLNL